MALIVQKYGGTSVGSAERIQSVANKVKKFVEQGDQVVVVVSAMSGETNRLIGLAERITDQPSRREMDVLLSTGEQVTIALLSMALEQLAIPAQSFTGWQAGIKTDAAHSKARISSIDIDRIFEKLKQNKVVIVAGFQGITEKGDVTTLGRGGSDTTAVALAAALKAAECQIYTDVDGVYTTDPRVESKARKLDQITFEEILEMASQGSKVLQIRSVEFAGKYKVPLRVLHSQIDGPGTLITTDNGDNMENPIVSGIAFNRDEAKLTILGVPDQPGIASKVLGAISDANIEVDMIVQSAHSGNTNDLSFTVHRAEYARSLEILTSVKNELNALKVQGDDTIAKLAIVGVGMRSHAGVASKMFETLAAKGINIEMISTSEIKIAVVIQESALETAVQSLHDAFELDQPVAV